jgi:hypothetical protein
MPRQINTLMSPEKRWRLQRSGALESTLAQGWCIRWHLSNGGEERSSAME